MRTVEAPDLSWLDCWDTELQAANPRLIVREWKRGGRVVHVEMLVNPRRTRPSRSDLMKMHES